MAKLILAQVLRRKGLSKRKFAKLLGMKYGNVFRLFQRDYDAKWSMVNKWAKALDCKVKDLIEE